jgi:predicted transcriptional regulator
MDDPPSSTALRTHFRILEQKGYVVSGKRARANIYRAKIARARVARPALQGVLDAFFGGSIADAVASHLADPSLTLDDDELNRLKDLINQRNKGNS